MKFLNKKFRFSVKSRFKESKCADGGHSLNRDFTVLRIIQPRLLLSGVYCTSNIRSSPATKKEEELVWKFRYFPPQYSIPGQNDGKSATTGWKIPPVFCSQRKICTRHKKSVVLFTNPPPTCFSVQTDQITTKLEEIKNFLLHETSLADGGGFEPKSQISTSICHPQEKDFRFNIPAANLEYWIWNVQRNPLITILSMTHHVLTW